MVTVMEQTWQEQLPLSGIREVTAVSGGDVNLAYCVQTDQQNYFLLVQPAETADFYAGEIAGLKALAAADIKAPRVLANGQINGDAFLLLDYLQQGPNGSQADLGRLVAKMHHYYSPTGKYGFSESYRGASMTFANTWTDSWAALFIDQRMDQLKDALVKKQLWQEAELERYTQVRASMAAELARHQSEPSLLHGDLWGGNHMFLRDGQPALIDPAAFYGDREFDLGCSLVFNAFDEEFYAAYQEAYPLAEGYQKRLKYYALYLLMIHLEKFGGIYAGEVDRLVTAILEEAN